MSDTRTPHEKIADRLAAGTLPGTVYDQKVLSDHHDVYNSDDRLQLRADREYRYGYVRTSSGSR